MSKNLDFLRSNNIDVYELLGIPKDAKESTIRKAYRKQALIFHPDKNTSPSAATTFHYLTLALGVLSDAQLRREYDAWMNAKVLEKVRNVKLNTERKRMKDELERAENESSMKDNVLSTGRWNKREPTESSNKLGIEIERLRDEGAAKRRAFEKEYLKKINTKPSDGRNSSNQRSNTELDRSVKVRWKIKEGISKLFTEDVLEGILSVFGDIERIEMLKRQSNEKRYDSAIVVFSSIKSAFDATSHDFSRSSKIWDNTSYKKLSGLLREVKWAKQGSNDKAVNLLNRNELTLQEYKDLTLMKLAQSDSVDSSHL